MINGLGKWKAGDVSETFYMFVCVVDQSYFTDSTG